MKIAKNTTRRQPQAVGYWVNTRKHDLFVMQVHDAGHEVRGSVRIELMKNEGNQMTQFHMLQSKFQSMVDAARLCGMEVK